MRVTLIEQRRETPEIMTFVFSLDGQKYSYTAGQFAFFELDELTVPDPRGKRRHFTISSAPSEDGIVQFTTKLRGFGLKETLKNAAPGLQVTLEEARGRFVLPNNSDTPLVFLGGGIGVTPFRSMLRFATDQLLPHKITMLYAAQSVEHIAFRREFELLPQENPNARIVLTVSDGGAEGAWSGEIGRIDAAMIEKYVSDIPSAVFYTCGPPPMVQAMEELLKSMKVASNRIQVERFSGYS